MKSKHKRIKLQGNCDTLGVFCPVCRQHNRRLLADQWYTCTDCDTDLMVRGKYIYYDKSQSSFSSSKEQVTNDKGNKHTGITREDFQR